MPVCFIVLIVSRYLVDKHPSHQPLQPRVALDKLFHTCDIHAVTHVFESPLYPFYYVRKAVGECHVGVYNLFIGSGREQIGLGNIRLRRHWQFNIFLHRGFHHLLQARPLLYYGRPDRWQPCLRITICLHLCHNGYIAVLSPAELHTSQEHESDDGGGDRLPPCRTHRSYLP